MKLRVNGGIAPHLREWLIQILKERPFLTWDVVFAAPLGLTQQQLAPLAATHASVSDALQALTRHDFHMAVRFHQQCNKEWLQGIGVTNDSLSADLHRHLQIVQIQPVATMRDAEKATNAETIADAVAAQTAVAQAVMLLKEFYAGSAEAAALQERMPTGKPRGED